MPGNYRENNLWEIQNYGFKYGHFKTQYIYVIYAKILKQEGRARIKILLIEKYDKKEVKRLPLFALQNPFEDKT